MVDTEAAPLVREYGGRRRLGHNREYTIGMKSITGLSDTSRSISDGNNITDGEHIQQVNGSIFMTKKNVILCVLNIHIIISRTITMV